MTKWTFTCALTLAACHRSTPAPPDASASTAPLPEPSDARALLDASPLDGASAQVIDAGAPLPAFATRPAPSGPFAVVLDGDCDDVDVDLGPTTTHVHWGQRIWTMTPDGQLGDERLGPDNVDEVSEVVGDFPDHAFVIARDGFRSDTSFHPFRFDAVRHRWSPLVPEESKPDFNRALATTHAHKLIGGGLVFDSYVMGDGEDRPDGASGGSKQRLIGYGAKAPALSPDGAQVTLLDGFATGEWFAVTVPGDDQVAELRWIRPGLPLQKLPIAWEEQYGALTAYAPDDVFLGSPYQDGTIRHFDGREWTIVKVPGAPAGEPGGRFFGRDATGLTWIGTSRKLLLVKPDGSVARSVPMKSSSYQVVGVHQGSPYLLAHDGGYVGHLSAWVDDKWQNVQLPRPTFNPTLSYDVTRAYVRGPGDVWLIAQYRYAENTDHFDGSHQGLNDAVLHTQPQNEVLRCGGYEALGDDHTVGPDESGTHAWAPGADAECRTPLLMIESTTLGDEKPDDYARARKVLRGLSESKATGAIVEEVAVNGRRYLAARAPDYATGMKLAKKLKATLEQSEPELVCADVVPTRTFDEAPPSTTDK